MKTEIFYTHCSFVLATTPTLPVTPTSTLPVVTSTAVTPVESAPIGVQTVRPAQTVTQIRIQTTAQPAGSAANTRRGLSLTVCKISLKNLLYRLN